MQDMGDSSLLCCLRPQPRSMKEEREESDLASYAPALSTHELMGTSAIGLSLHEDEEEDMEKSPFSQHDFHDITRTPSFTDHSQQETAIPRLMQMQMEKYGTSYFQRNESGYYTCFFVGCGKKLQANFSRHIAKHEQDGDGVDPNLAQNMKSTSPAGPPMQTCSHPHHMAWWQTAPELPIGEFYNRSYKCKRCYIKQQMDRKKMRNATEKPDGKEIANSSDSALSNSPGTPPTNDLVPSAEVEEHVVERPAKKKKMSYNIKDELILPEGWTTHSTTRKQGKSAGRVVPYWVSPEGKKFRSKSDIKKFLAKIANPNGTPAQTPAQPSLSSSSPNPSFPPLSASPSLSSSVELSSSILTPLEEDKLFGGMMHQQRESIGFKPMLPLDDEPLMSANSLSGFVNTQFTGALPHQTEGSCKITGYLEGIGILTQITVGDKTFQGFALNEDLATLTSFPPPYFSVENYREAEKHLKTCRGLVVGEIVKAKGPEAFDEFRDPFRNGHRNGPHHAATDPLLALHSNIHNHITGFNDQLITHLNAHIGNINSHLLNHRPLPPLHLPHPSPSLPHPLLPSPTQHPPHHPLHHRDGRDSNSGSDTENDLAEDPKNPVDYTSFVESTKPSKTSVDYTNFDAGADDFLTVATGGSVLMGDGSSPGNSDASSIGMDVIADEIELDATQDLAQEVPRHAYAGGAHGTGLLNTHMLINTRHVN